VPSYEIRSAGEADPRGEPIERLRPRAGEEDLLREFRTDRAAQALDAETFSQRLGAALAADPAVIQTSCSVIDGEPRLMSFPEIVRTDELSAEDESALLRAQRIPDPGRLVEIVVRVAAPTRRQAFDLVNAAIWRAHTATGEQPGGFWIGQIDLRQVD